MIDVQRLSLAWSKTFLPFASWIGELRKPEVLRADLIAGITVALVLVPQSMAYAQLAGLPVYYGLYASFLPPMVAAIFGSSRQLATGPVAAALEPLASGNPEGLWPTPCCWQCWWGSFRWPWACSGSVSWSTSCHIPSCSVSPMRAR